MIRGPLAACLMLALAACASGTKGTASDAPSRRSDLLTQSEIHRVPWRDAYEMVSNLRPLWLRQRGTDSINGQPSELQVLLDGVRLGGVSALRNMPLVGIASMQYYDPITAGSRFGLGFGNGAIYITQGPR
jgi:hypothetical protein